ncbi:unnamed protein product, partial [Nesidiocoris tenuis]
LRGGQNGFHTNQHLPQPFHPPSRHFPVTGSAVADSGLDYSDRGADRYKEIVRGQSVVNERPSYQQPPSRAAPTGPALTAGAAYQEIVRSTGSSFFPSRPSALVDQLDSTRWRTSPNGNSRRKPPPTAAVPPPVDDPVRDVIVNTLPSAVSSASADGESSNFGPDSQPTRGRSRFKNVRVESTPFTIATTSASASNSGPTRAFGPSALFRSSDSSMIVFFRNPNRLISRASRTRRPPEVKKVTTLRPTTVRSTTTTTTTTTEPPHYDPDYELEYILEPEEEGLQEELPALLGPNNNDRLREKCNDQSA